MWSAPACLHRRASKNGLVVAMGQGNSQGELAGDPRGIARFYPALEMAMWQGDSQGDSLGIPEGLARLLEDSL